VTLAVSRERDLCRCGGLERAARREVDDIDPDPAWIHCLRADRQRVNLARAHATSTNGQIYRALVWTTSSLTW
jgi:hypothetical protein